MKQTKRWATAACLSLSVFAMGACDDLLDVELPHQLTGDALQDPGSASTQVASAIAQFECGASAFTWVALGHEDVFESIAGVAGNAHLFRETSVTGGCDDSSQDQSWYDQFMGARSIITNDQATGIYDRLQNDWDATQVPTREQLMAVSSVYAAAIFEHFGTYYCELAIDGGTLMTPDAVLATAETWITTANGHIAANGDFVMPYGASGTNMASEMTAALSARIRWMRGDLAGANTAAAGVSMGFESFITRETGPKRRNKVYDAGTAVGFSGMLGVNDWWNSAVPNPATGNPWPSPIPYTGYLNLGIDGTDGRAVQGTGFAVLETDAGAVDDTRVDHFVKAIQGPVPRDVPNKYTAESDDIPLVTWREIWLIRAEYENDVNSDRAAAIALVNALRTNAGLPTVTYIDGTASRDEVHSMIIEERRRELFAEGRYWATKIQNPDMLWFPRGDGATPEQGYQYGGGVRMLMPTDEYQLNTNLSLSDRASMCNANEAPVVIG